MNRFAFLDPLKTVFSKPKRAFLILSAILVLGTGIATGFALRSPRYRQTIDFGAMTERLSESDLQPLLVPIRMNMTDMAIMTSFLTADGEQSALILNTMSDQKTLSATQKANLDAMITMIKQTIDHYYQTKTQPYIALRNEYLAVLEEVALLDESLAGGVPETIKNAKTMAMLEVINRRITNYQVKIDRFVLANDSVQNLSAEACVKIVTHDRWRDLFVSVLTLLGVGTLLNLMLVKRLSKNQDAKRRFDTLIPERFRESWDLAVVGLLLLAFLGFSSVTVLKLLALGMAGLSVLLTKRFKPAPHWFLLAILIFMTLLLNLNNPMLSAIVDETVSRFLLGLIVSGLIWLTLADAKPGRSVLLAQMIIGVLLIVLVLYLPSLIHSGRITLVRFGEESFLNLVYVSSNLLAFYAFVGHVLTAWVRRSSQPGIFGKPWVTWMIQGLFLGLGLMSQSRGYYVFVLTLGLTFAALRWMSHHQRQLKRVLMVTGIVLGIGLIVILTLRSSPDFAVWLSKSTANITPLSLKGRFISLIKLVFTNLPLIDPSTLERFHLMKAAFVLFVKHPFFGVGLGAFGSQSASLLNQGVFLVSNQYSHVEFMEMISSAGLVGTVLYYVSYVPLLKIRKQSLLLFVFLIVCLGYGFVFRIYYEKMIWWILITLIALISKEASHEN